MTAHPYKSANEIKSRQNGVGAAFKNFFCLLE